MKIEIKRYRIRESACDGILSINGRKLCDTAENTQFMPPSGTYNIVLRSNKKQKRIVPYLLAPNNEQKMTNGKLHAPFLCIGNGIYHRCDGRIIVGTHIVPGCVKRSYAPFKRLYDRINNTIRRGKSVCVTISEISINHKQ